MRRIRHRATVLAVISAMAGFVLVNALLAAPARQLVFPPQPRLAAEALILAGCMLLATLLTPRLQHALADIFAGLLLIASLLKLASIAQYYSLGRPLNVAIDWGLLRPAFDMMAGTLGVPVAILASLALVFLIVALWRVLAKCLRALTGVSRFLTRAPTFVAGSALAALGLGFSVSIWPGWSSGSVSAIANRLVFEQSVRAARTIREQAAFRAALRDDPLRSEPDPVAGLAGTDMLLIFVESYGAVALDDPEFSALIGPRLTAMEGDLAGAGLHAVSAWLTSPTIGGQSWLAHASLLSGINIDNDIKYQVLIGSEHLTLIDLFERSGHRSVAVMPAINRPWPEGEALGYDRIYSASGLGYRATPFNWVTMPDQFTLATFERLERAEPIGARQPIFAEIALISSHAPWTPIAEMVDWESVDESGMVFDTMAQRGPSPAQVWLDRETVRRHYARTLDYSLETIGSYAARFAARDTLMIVVGDHQPAPMLTGPGHGRAVPVHIIASEQALLEPFRQAGYSDGLRPEATASCSPMADMRALIADAF